MAHFTKLDDDDLRSLAAEFSLGSLRRWKSIAAGTINSNYQLETSEGTFFLRVNEGKGLPEVELEVAVLTHLVAKGIASPLPRQGLSGERFALWRDKYISVFDWLPGSHVDARSIRDEHCRSVGRALAELHQASDGMDISSIGEGRYAYEKIRKLHASFAESKDSKLAAVNALVREEFAWLDSQAAVRGHGRRAVIHADLFPDNVLIEQDQIVAILDFEQACVGSLVYDLAVTINAWCFAEALVPGRLRALVAGYQEQSRLDSAEVAALLVELRAAALRFTVTRITDVYLPRSGREGQQVGKDFRRFQLRLESWRALRPNELLDIADLAQHGSQR